ncbi:MAG: NfeD family protein [Halothiobacillaceae bacterium]|nr:NfeD family protein [Halothiobacillaceae bacterium]HUN00152.1 NfeD family protein [Halothiobacillus sp.]
MIQFDYWGWFILGIVLAVIEILAPSSFFLWMGGAAILVGGIVFLVPDLIWPIQLSVFAVLSILAVLLGRRVFRPSKQATDHPTLNRRGEQYIGRHFTLEAPIVNGIGWVRVGDSRWRVLGEDLPVGTVVEVTGIDSSNFLVRPIPQ